LNPLEGDYLIKGIKFQWDDGIFSVALGKRNKTNGYRTAYFHAASSYSEFRVSTEVLKNETYVRQSYHGNHFKVQIIFLFIATAFVKMQSFSIFKLLGRRPIASNVGIHVYHVKTGVMFNAELQKYRITCINLGERFRANNIGVVYKNEEKLIYPSDLSVIIGICRVKCTSF
jgi:dopachrome tautomerase